MQWFICVTATLIQNNLVGVFIMSKYFTDNDLDGLVFYQVPKVLVLGEKYRKMKANALKLYMVLFDRMKLSMDNQWKDESGRYYARMSQEGAAELFGWSPTTFRSMKKELEEYGLLEQSREGQGKANKLYVLKCDYDEDDIYKLNKSVDSEFEENEKEAVTIDKSKKNKSCSTRRTKVDLLEEQKLTPNKTDFNKTDSNKSLNIVNKKERVDNYSDEFLEVDIYELEKEYRLNGLSQEVIDRVKAEVDEKREHIKNYPAYYRSCLDNTLYKSKLKHGHIDMPYPHLGEDHPLNYGWLNE